MPKSIFKLYYLCQQRTFIDCRSGNKQCCPPSSHQSLQMHQWCRILALDSWQAFQRNNFIGPRLLNLPIHRKVLKSLTLEIVFFVMRIISWYSTSFFHSKNSYILWLFPYLFGKILRVIWEAVSQTIVHSKGPRIKCNSRLLGCVCVHSTSPKQ